MRKKKSKFKTVYYIVQTAPFFKTCGQSFSRQIAEYVAYQIYTLTGIPGRVVEFSREELKELKYRNTHGQNTTR